MRQKNAWATLVLGAVFLVSTGCLEPEPGPQCPDPEDPNVHYIQGTYLNPEQCHVIDFTCDEGQEMFYDECGCGCIGEPDPECPDPEDPNVHYVEGTYRNPEQCHTVLFECDEGQEMFYNECGCGCIGEPDPECPDPSDPAVHYIEGTREDPGLCHVVDFVCAQWQEMFYDECGCGCIDRGLQPGFEALLTEQAGCSDTRIHATNPEGTMALLFTSHGIAEYAHEAGETVTIEQSLESFPDSELGATLNVWLGENFDGFFCNDAIDPNHQPIYAREYEALSGTAIIILTPEGEPTPWGAYHARATLTLRDVVLQGDDGTSVPLDFFEIKNVFVGWLPG